MNKDLYLKAVRELWKSLKENKYSEDRLVYYALQGSQNYNLDNDESDFDFKVFVYPTFEDLYYNNSVSKTYKYQYGQYEVKDVRLLPELLKKMNPSYLELFATHVPKFNDRFKVNKKLFDKLLQDRKSLLVKSLFGFILQRSRDLEKPMESTKDKVLLYGYDPKQLSHMERYVYMLDVVVNKSNLHLEDLYLLDEKTKQQCLLLKYNPTFTLEKAREYAKELKSKAEQLVKKFDEDNVEFILDDWSYLVLKALVYNLVYEYFNPKYNEN